MKGLAVTAKTLGIQATTQNIGMAVTFEQAGLAVYQARYGLSAGGISGSEGDYSVYWVFDDGERILFDNGDEIDVG